MLSILALGPSRMKPLCFCNTNRPQISAGYPTTLHRLHLNTPCTRSSLLPHSPLLAPLLPLARSAFAGTVIRYVVAFLDFIVCNKLFRIILAPYGSGHSPFHGCSSLVQQLPTLAGQLRSKRYLSYVLPALTFPTQYQGGSSVIFNSQLWTAKQWTYNNNPESSAAEWTQIGCCTEPITNKADCTSIPGWNQSTAYTKGVKVIYNGRLWIATQSTQSNHPGDTSGTWQYLGDCKATS